MKWEWRTILVRTWIGTLMKRILTCLDQKEDSLDWANDGQERWIKVSKKSWGRV